MVEFYVNGYNHFKISDEKYVAFNVNIQCVINSYFWKPSHTKSSSYGPKLDHHNNNNIQPLLSISTIVLRTYLDYLIPKITETEAQGSQICLRSHSCEVEVQPEFKACSVILEHILGNTAVLPSLETHTAKLSSS